MTVTGPATQKLTVFGKSRAEVPSKNDVLIGHDLLELLTQAMYVDPLTIYREYIQNSTDAIEESQREGIFTPNETGRVDLQIDLTDRLVRIRDNGASIPRAQFVKRLLAIGLSTKRGKGLRGFRGIGRLAGLGYCQELVFRGRAEVRDPVTEISWDARRLKDLLSSDSVHNLQSAISEIATVNRPSTGSWPARFFEVELRKVIRIKNDLLLNPEAIRGYLSQVAPVPFRQEFEYSDRIKEFLHGYAIGEVVDIAINGSTTVRRPHESIFALTPKVIDRFCDIQFFEIPGLDGGLDAVGWVLDHSYLGALPRRLNIGGLRLRVGNFQIGESDSLAELFSEPRFNSWCVGEFHILNKKILPNGRRDAFEHSAHYINLQSYMSKIATELSRTCRARSGVRNLIKATIQNLQKIENDLKLIRSIPHDFPFRQKQIDTLRLLLSKQQAQIQKHWPQNADRETILKRILDLRRRTDRAAAQKTKGTLFKRIVPTKKKAYGEVLSAIYEVTNDTAAAHDCVRKLLTHLRKRHN